MFLSIRSNEPFRPNEFRIKNYCTSNMAHIGIIVIKTLSKKPVSQMENFVGLKVCFQQEWIRSWVTYAKECSRLCLLDVIIINSNSLWSKYSILNSKSDDHHW